MTPLEIISELFLPDHLPQCTVAQVVLAELPVWFRASHVCLPNSTFKESYKNLTQILKFKAPLNFKKNKPVETAILPCSLTPNTSYVRFRSNCNQLNFVEHLADRPGGFVTKTCRTFNKNRLCSKTCGINNIVKNPRKKTTQRSNLNFLL